MKPKNNRVWCPDCGRPKMLFETESKAKNFIKWNGEEIDSHGGELRPYYCPGCCGWHISSKEHKNSYDHHTDDLISAYTRSVKAGETRLLGISETLRFYDRTKAVIKIWDEMPKEVKNSDSKNVVKKWMSEFFKQRGLTDSDGGIKRKAIYDMWEEYKSGRS